jgi:hypothetical protein
MLYGDDIEHKVRFDNVLNCRRYSNGIHLSVIQHFFLVDPSRPIPEAGSALRIITQRVIY